MSSKPDNKSKIATRPERVIGVFDSGVGGLTVVKEILRLLPGYKIVYFGDTARIPYGTKSKETITKFSSQDIDFLLSKGASLVVAACNTASALSIETLKSRYSIPLFEVVSGGVKEAVRVTKQKRIGIIGTTGTIRSGVHEAQLKARLPDAQVFSAACPLLVSLVEEGWHKRPETKRIIRSYLRPLKNKQIDTLILACTHFPLLRDMIADVMGPRVTLVDPSTELAEELREYVANHPDIEKLLAKGKYDYYASDVPNNFDRFAKILFGKAINVQKVDID